MPRMELVAATLSVKISVLLKKELQISIKKEMFWTDSEVVLAFIRNEAKIFVANRIELIKEHSDDCQWFYINSKQNPANHASRGIDICNQNKVLGYAGLLVLHLLLLLNPWLIVEMWQA